MQLLVDLLTTDYGLVALVVTLVSLGLALGFHVFIRRKIRESEAAPTASAGEESR